MSVYCIVIFIHLCVSIIYLNFGDDFVLLKNIFSSLRYSFTSSWCFSHSSNLFAFFLPNGFLYVWMLYFYFSFIFVTIFLCFVSEFLSCTFICKIIFNFIIYSFLIVSLQDLHISSGFLVFIFLKMLDIPGILVGKGILWIEVYQVIEVAFLIFQLEDFLFCCYN